MKAWAAAAQWLKARLVTLCWAYGTVLGLWLVGRAVLGDFSWWAFAINAFLLYAFLPVPGVLAVAGWSRRAEVWAIGAAAGLVWAGGWGGLWLPGAPAAAAPEATATVMAYNVLGYNLNTPAVLEVLREADADVVALQELNLENGAAIARELAAEYPHQWLEPQAGVGGGGLISRLPFERLDSGLLAEMGWVSPPMVVRLTVAGRPVTLVRFHAYANPGFWREREIQAGLLARFAREAEGPLVVVGDLNATDQNAAYGLLARELRDAWREAGWGFGHTFPGEPTAAVGGSRPVLMGVPVPLWLVRIDFVFHSAHWAALDARLGPYDGASDHRPLIATLGLK